MGGTATIGIPDTSQLPIQTNQSQYDLRRAATDLAPEVAPPPAAAIGPQEDQPPSPYQIPASGFGNAPQFSQPSPFDRLQVQPQQFQQPDFQQPQYSLQPLIEQEAARYQQMNQQAGKGVAHHLFSTFLGGMGKAMMHSYGLETPEEQQDRRMGKIIALSNAQSQQDLRNVEMQRYQMDIQRAPIIDPQTGQPVLGQDGQPLNYPKWQAEKLQQGLVDKMNQRPERWTPEQQVYAKSYDQYIQEGKTPAQAHDLLQKQPVQAVHTANTAEGVLEKQADGSWKRIGGSPKSNVNLMTTNDAKDIADAIENGDQPPTLQGLYRNAGPVRAELARRKFPLAQAETDWKAVQRHINTLNGPQQTRLMQSITSASEMVDKIDGLYQEWQQLAPTSGFKVLNRAALTASKNVGGRTGAVATALDAQIADLTADLGNVYMGGNSPTDHALGLAGKNLSSDWNQETFEEALKQTRANIGIRKNSILHSQPVGVSSNSPYVPATGASAPPAGVFDWSKMPEHKP